MPEFRKKPVVVNAMQFVGSLGSYLDVCDWMKSFGASVKGTEYRDPSMMIPTLEGEHIASAGDWIIRGVAGEFYPCKPDIFAATYEPAGTATDAARTGEEG